MPVTTNRVGCDVDLVLHERARGRFRDCRHLGHRPLRLLSPRHDGCRCMAAAPQFEAIFLGTAHGEPEVELLLTAASNALRA